MPYRLDTEERVHIYMDEFYCLSNFAAFRLTWKGVDWDTSEHAYQASKFTDPSVRHRIQFTRSAHAAFKIADAYRHIRRPDWESVRLDVMREIIRAKHEQHQYVKVKLLETGDREIVEDSWRDDFWGTGPDGTGQNWLGKLWMELRDEIRARDT